MLWTLCCEIYDNKKGIFLNKTCPVHGESSYLIETDKNFYKQLGYDQSGYSIPQE